MDEKIEVGYRNIGSLAGKDYHHKFILYTDKDGHQRTISGWTGERSPDLPYGLMDVKADLPYDAGNPDHPRNINALGQAQYREVIAQGSDLSGIWRSMVADAKAKDDRYPYDPQVQNSNTLADSILRDAKLKEPSQDGFGEHWAPASGRNLDESVKPSIPGLGNSGRTFSEADAAQDAMIEDPMFQRALAALDRAGPTIGGFENDQDKERIAGALALQARSQQLPDIHQVMHNPENGKTFAVWQNPGNSADVMRAVVERDVAAGQPLGESLAALDAVRQLSQDNGREQGIQEERSRGAMSL